MVEIETRTALASIQTTLLSLLANGEPETVTTATPLNSKYAVATKTNKHITENTSESHCESDEGDTSGSKGDADTTLKSIHNENISGGNNESYSKISRSSSAFIVIATTIDLVDMIVIHMCAPQLFREADRSWAVGFLVLKTMRFLLSLACRGYVLFRAKNPERLLGTLILVEIAMFATMDCTLAFTSGVPDYKVYIHGGEGTMKNFFRRGDSHPIPSLVSGDSRVMPISPQQ